jgi:hypothetical protein
MRMVTEQNLGLCWVTNVNEEGVRGCGGEVETLTFHVTDPLSEPYFAMKYTFTLSTLFVNNFLINNERQLKLFKSHSR